MEQNKQPIPENEILDRIKELPVLNAGIGKPDEVPTRYVPETSLDKLQESADEILRGDENADAVLKHAASKHEEYPKKLDAAHNYVKAKLRIKHVDIAAPETYAKGIATSEHVKSLLHSEHVPDDSVYHALHAINENNSHVAEVLNEAYMHVLDSHIKEPKHFDISKSLMSHSDAMNIPYPGMKPSYYGTHRTLSMDAGYTSHMFEKDGDHIRYLGSAALHSDKTEALTSQAFKSKYHQSRNNFVELHLHEHYTNEFRNNSETLSDHPLTKYTTDSSAVNRYLHIKHADKDVDDIMGIDPAIIHRDSIKMSNSIRDVKHPHGLPDFHVYTGAYRETMIDNPASHQKDEMGNYLLHAPSFTSTSLDLHTAVDFAKQKEHHTEHTVSDILKIKIPGGYHRGAYVAGVSEHENENEYLLDKGHTFRVHPEPKVSYRSNHMVRMWDAEIIHPMRDSERVKAVTPEHFNAMSKSGKLDLLSHPDAPEHAIHTAFNDHDMDLVQKAVKHHSISDEDFEKASHHWHPVVSGLVTHNPKATDEHWNKVLNSNEPATLLVAAGSPHLTPEHAHKIVDAGFPKPCAMLAGREDMPHEVRQKIHDSFEYGYGKNEEVSLALAGNPKTHPKILHELITSDSPRGHVSLESRRAAAKNPNIEFADMHDAYSGEFYGSQRAVAENPKYPDYLKQLKGLKYKED